MRIILSFIIICSSFILQDSMTQEASARKCPQIRLEVTGTIKYWESNEPLEGVQFLGFVGNQIWAGHHGYNALSLSNPNGQFSVPVTTSTKCKPIENLNLEKIELIAFKEGYRTQKYIFEDTKFEPFDDKSKYHGKIIINKDLAMSRSYVESEYEEDKTDIAEIISFEVVQNLNDKLVLDVEYSYHPINNEEALLSAITLLNGNSTGHWAYKAVILKQGQNKATISISISDEAPKKYFSNEILFEIRTDNNGILEEKRSFPFEKNWTKN